MTSGAWCWEEKPWKEDRVQADGHTWRRLSAALLRELADILHGMPEGDEETRRIAKAAEEGRRRLKSPDDGDSAINRGGG